ncbi:lecithin retinol acyltransferase family protein [Nocardioides sp.]|uniref:lecithin retinol acyltransferase family protein n=1 Tax=Nocardioides sp. TaxID=35761 RepID=UPI0037844C5A
MARGDHVFVRRGRRYSHHGIDCGDGTVIHFGGTRGTIRRIERTTYAAFADGGEVLVRAYRTRLPVEEIIANAESRLGTQQYHLVRNNCEHFATWASTGSPRSRQVRGWAVAAPSAFASIGVAEAAGAHAIFLGGLGVGAYAASAPLRRRRLAGRSGTPGQRPRRSDRTLRVPEAG